MSNQGAHQPRCDLPQWTRPLRCWDRQLIWLSAIGISTLAWTAVTLLAFHGV